MRANDQGQTQGQQPSPEGAGDAVLRFRIPEMELCVPLACVDKVFSLMALQTVPQGPAYLRGLMNLHGDSIPVIELAARLGLSTGEPYTLDTPILLCGYGGLRAGLIIDEVLGVESVPAGALQMGAQFDEAQLPFNAVLSTSEGLCMMLNLGRVLAIDFSAREPSAPIDAGSLALAEMQL